MHQSDPNWRSRYYAAALYKMLAVSVEISNRQTLEARSARYSRTSVLAVVRPTQSTCTSPVSPASGESETLINSSPSTVGSRSSQHSSLVGHYNSSFTAPTSDSTGSPTSPSLPASPTSASGMISCPDPSCPEKFKPISGATNVLRHLKTSRAHGNGAMYYCHKEGCAKRFSRSDNLNHHIQKVHGEPAPPPTRRRGLRKRRRELDDVPEQDERAFRPDGADLVAQEFARPEGNFF